MSISETFQTRWQKWKAEAPQRRLAQIPKDIEWGKRLFFDTTPATEHLRGGLFLARARLFGGFRPTTAAGRESRRKGFRALGPIAPSHVLNPIIETLTAVLSTPRDDDYIYKGVLATRSLTYATREVPELMRLIAPKMLDAVGEYY